MPSPCGHRWSGPRHGWQFVRGVLVPDLRWTVRVCLACEEQRTEKTEAKP